jgi:hypothetical protein
MLFGVVIYRAARIKNLQVFVVRSTYSDFTEAKVFCEHVYDVREALAYAAMCIIVISLNEYVTLSSTIPHFPFPVLIASTVFCLMIIFILTWSLALSISASRRVDVENAALKIYKDNYAKEYADDVAAANGFTLINDDEIPAIEAMTAQNRREKYPIFKRS